MSTSGAAQRSSGFELSIRPSVAIIAMTREFVFTFANRILGDVDMSSRLAVTVHELLENCLKYSTDGEATLSVELGAGKVSMKVRNRAGEDQITALREALAELAEATNPSAFYTMALMRAAKRKEGSGLGLARIWAEAGMVLRGEFDGDVVALVVEA
jgi:hypothetical protein